MSDFRLGKKYHVILVDPPWQFRDKRKSGRTKCGAENHYPCMSLDEMKALPIGSLAEPNAVIYIWATWPLMLDPKRPSLSLVGSLMEAWGFGYKTLGFDWEKTNKNGQPWFGIGAYAKSNPEPCLMGVRGKVGRLLRDENGLELVSDPKVKMRVRTNSISALVQAPRGKHSAKPEEVYRRIEALWGDVSRIEVFARRSRPGWDSIGNEIDGRSLADVLRGEKEVIGESS